MKKSIAVLVRSLTEENSEVEDEEVVAEVKKTLKLHMLKSLLILSLSSKSRALCSFSFIIESITRFDSMFRTF